MAELTVDDITWKKGETGTQKFILYDSDGVTRHNGTGNTYALSFWDEKTNTEKGSGALSATNASQGEYSISVTTGFTDTVKTYLGEITETSGGQIYKSNTFKVIVQKSGP